MGNNALFSTKIYIGVFYFILIASQTLKKVNGIDSMNTIKLFNQNIFYNFFLKDSVISSIRGLHQSLNV